MSRQAAWWRVAHGEDAQSWVASSGQIFSEDFLLKLTSALIQFGPQR